jgi:cytochrome c peroxidase
VDPGACADRRRDCGPDPGGRRGELALRPARSRLAAAAAALSACAALLGAGEPPAPYAWHLPRGFPLPAVPADNPMSEAKVRLGERLFFDPRLSVTGRYSCASCHDPARAFSDPKPRAVGATGATLPHHALPLINVAYNIAFGWDKPRVRSLEAQMLTPLLNQHPIELGLKGRERPLISGLAADPAYARAFADSFPGEADPVSFGHLVKAIAAFERTLISGDSPFDRYVFAGEDQALSGEAKRGMALFFSARVGCAGCHSGFNFAGNWRDAQGATGRAGFANDGTSEEPLKVPTLRNVALTAPYMHDGRFATLAEVLAHYSDMAAKPRAAGAPSDPRLPRAALTPEDRAALTTFLDSLTDASFAARFASRAGSR